MGAVGAMESHGCVWWGEPVNELAKIPCAAERRTRSPRSARPAGEARRGQLPSTQPVDSQQWSQVPLLAPFLSGPHNGSTAVSAHFPGENTEAT